MVILRQTVFICRGGLTNNALVTNSRGGNIYANNNLNTGTIENQDGTGGTGTASGNSIIEIRGLNTSISECNMTNRGANYIRFNNKVDSNERKTALIGSFADGDMLVTPDNSVFNPSPRNQDGVLWISNSNIQIMESVAL